MDTWLPLLITLVAPDAPAEDKAPLPDVARDEQGDADDEPAAGDDDSAFADDDADGDADDGDADDGADDDGEQDGEPDGGQDDDGVEPYEDEPPAEYVEPEPPPVVEPRAGPDVAVTVPSTASPTKPQPEVPESARTWTVGGFVDVAYLVNSNFPDNHLYRGTVTTPRTGEFTVNLGAAYLTHAPVEDEPWRFELGLQFGAATDALYAGEPVPGGDDGGLAGPEVWKHVALANAGGKIEKTGTEIGAGLFASPIGIGGFWSPLNWNYSPSWESNAAPFYLAGARVQQDLPAGFGLQAWIVNGWQTVGDANKAPAYLAGLTWNKDTEGGSWSVAQFLYFGPDDQDLAVEAWRVHSDTQATWEGRRGGVGVVWDYGQEKVTTLPDDPVHVWTGGGLFTHYLAHDGKRVDVDLAARPDAWFDRNGRIYGVPQWLVSGTGTLNVTFFDMLLLRAEYRFDHSTAENGFFYQGEAISGASPDLANNQHTVFFSVAGTFEHAFALRRPE